MTRIHFMYGCIALMGCGDVDTYELQETPSEDKEGPTAVDESNSNTENNNGDNGSSGQNPDETNDGGTDGNNNENTNREPASEPSMEPEIPSYIGGYNVNPCTTNVQPSGYGIGQVAGDFQLVDQYGETLRLSDFCGNTVVLVAAAFW